MNKILRFKLSEELVDIENNKGKMLYHFIVTNEVDAYSLDKLMIFFESSLTNKEILNRSEIIGVTGEMEHAIPTNTILGIFTFKDKKILEEYKESRKNFYTTRKIQDQRQADLNWQTLLVSKEFRENEIEEIEEKIRDLPYDSDYEFEEMVKLREELEDRLKRMKGRIY
jgi:hypothetical protein